MNGSFITIDQINQTVLLARYDMEEGILQEMLVTRFIDLVVYNVPGAFCKKRNKF